MHIETKDIVKEISDPQDILLGFSQIAPTLNDTELSQKQIKEERVANKLLYLLFVGGMIELPLNTKHHVTSK